MKLQLIGVNHKTAPVEVRERLAIPDSRLPEACRRLAEHPGIDEGMILSTCNRVEVLAHMKNGAGVIISALILMNSSRTSTNITSRKRFAMCSAWLQVWIRWWSANRRF